MKHIVCEMCGSNDLIKQDGVFVCQSCGCKYTLEEARKLMIEGTVDVSGSRIIIDKTEKLDNLFVLARRARDTSNYEDALKFYEQIVEEDPNAWEAIFYRGYYRVVRAGLDVLPVEVANFSNSFDTIGSLLEEPKTDEVEKASQEMESRVKGLALELIRATMSNFHTNGTIEKVKIYTETTNGLILKMVESLADSIRIHNLSKEASTNLYRKALDLFKLTNGINNLRETWVAVINKKIVNLDPEYQKVIDAEEKSRRIKELNQTKQELEEKIAKSPRIGSALAGGIIFGGMGIIIIYFMVVGGMKPNPLLFIFAVICLLISFAQFVGCYERIKNKSILEKEIENIAKELKS